MPHSIGYKNGEARLPFDECLQRLVAVDELVVGIRQRPNEGGNRWRRPLWAEPAYRKRVCCACVSA